MKIGIIIFAIFYSSSVFSQSCEIYEIKGIPTYFYLVKGEKNGSKINDSLSYMFEKIGEGKYRIEKILNGIVINNTEYSYSGKKRYQSFKIKKRKFNKVFFFTEKRLICLLEKIE